MWAQRYSTPIQHPHTLGQRYFAKQVRRSGRSRWRGPCLPTPCTPSSLCLAFCWRSTSPVLLGLPDAQQAGFAVLQRCHARPALRLIQKSQQLFVGNLSTPCANKAPSWHRQCGPHGTGSMQRLRSPSHRDHRRRRRPARRIDRPKKRPSDVSPLRSNAKRTRRACWPNGSCSAEKGWSRFRSRPHSSS